ncbi:MAG: formate dehydrogenase accessory protein FdhE [Acidobacteria bacterium]|nr:formate dehydrogenase accessory protein FdhE [Acidobacteriota bacterium]
MSRFAQRAIRARKLASQHTAAAPSLEFFAALSDLQSKNASPDAYARLTPQPPPEEWLSRVMEELQPSPPEYAPSPNLCPQCGSPPQAGILRPQGDGHALYLACALCRHEWAFSRKICPNCESENISFATAESLPGYQTLTCDACKVYLHLLEEVKLPGCIPEADEIAAQPLDVWALENGYHKLTPNLVGI